MSRFFRRFYSASVNALPSALRTILWILRLMLPVTLAVSCLSYAGVVAVVSEPFEPLFRSLGLPAEAVVVFLTSTLLTIYSAIAIMATIGFDYRSVVILAVMCLIAHNMIIETAIQRKAKASALWMVVLRLVSALFAAFILNIVLPENLDGHLVFGEAPPAVDSWGGVFTAWATAVVPLCLKMICFVIGLNILQNILREFRVIDKLIYPLKPLMRLFGLPEKASFLWVVANTVGLTYGGALLVREIEEGEMDDRDASLLNTHIAVSHSLLEDTLIFVAVGVGVFWLIVPRVLIAIAAVWGERFVRGRGFVRVVLGTIPKK